MPYSYRVTWPGEDRPDDYVFLHNGIPRGRCYRIFDPILLGGGESWL